MNFSQIVYLLVFLGLCEGSFNSVVDWLGYVGAVKDQKQTGMCWAFSAVSYLETVYNIRTHNLFRLSPEQIGDNLIDFYASGSYSDSTFLDCKESFEDYKLPNYNGGMTKCALDYVSKKGIMTDYDYPFTEGGEYPQRYNVSIITPVGVKNIVVSSGILSIDDLYFKLLGGPLLISVKSAFIKLSTKVSSYYVMNETDTTGHTDHAMLCLGLFKNTEDNDYYAAIQNSWGYTYSYIYLRLTVNSTVVNNYHFFDNIVSADVVSRYAEGTSFTISADTLSKIETMINSSKISDDYRGFLIAIVCFIAIFAFIGLTAVVRWIYILFKERFRDQNIRNEQKTIETVTVKV